MNNRRGFALLEALIALSILGAAGLSFVALVQSGLEHESRARALELQTANATRVLTAMTLLTRSDLDLRLGVHPVGEFMVGVARPEPMLYRVAIGPAEAPGVELLVTVVYRP